MFWCFRENMTKAIDIAFSVLPSFIRKAAQFVYEDVGGKCVPNGVSSKYLAKQVGYFYFIIFNTQEKRISLKFNSSFKFMNLNFMFLGDIFHFSNNALFFLEYFQISKMLGDYFFSCDSLWLADQIASQNRSNETTKQNKNNVFIYYFAQHSR